MEGWREAATDKPRGVNLKGEDNQLATMYICCENIMTLFEVCGCLRELMERELLVEKQGFARCLMADWKTSRQP